MRKFFALLTISLGALATDVTRPAPEFVIQLPGGGHQLLSSYKGKTILLAFMHTTCTHCQKTAGELAAIQKEYAGKGVQVLGVTFDPGAAKRVQQFNKTFGVTYPCGFSDEKTVLPFLRHPPAEPYFVPILVFVDRSFNIRSQYIGDENFLSNIPVSARAELDKLLK